MWMPILLLGCAASIRGDFEAARDAALADPPPLAADWSPDLEVQLSGEAVSTLLDAATDALPPLKTTQSIGPASVTPRLTVKHLALSPQKGADDLLLDVSAKGRIKWTAGPLNGSLPLSVDAVAAATVDTERRGEAWVATVRLTSVRSASVDIDGAIAGVKGLDERVQEWVDDALTELPPVELPPVGGSDLPLRGLRVVQAGDGLRLLAKTDANVDARVQRPRGMPSSGVRVALASEALIAVARTAAFQQGEVAYGIVGDPRSIAFTPTGFDLGLRLWRPVGRGWWRDYQVSGTATVAPRKVKLAASDVEQTAQSPGADMADVLAFLAEGLIVRTLEDALVAAVPATTQVVLGDTTVQVDVDSLGPGPGSAVVLQGALGATK
jgi:hypothetical protein